MTISKELHEYVFYLEHERDKPRNGRTQTIWATDPEDAERRLQSWRHFGYVPRFLHSMDDFRKKCEQNASIEERYRQAMVEHEHHTAKSIETENV